MGARQGGMADKERGNGEVDENIGGQARMVTAGTKRSGQRTTGTNRSG